VKTLWRLLIFLKPYLGMVGLSILAGIATIACGIGLLGTSAYLLATAALKPSIAVLQVAIVGVRFFGLSRGIFRYLERLASHTVNLKLLSQWRTWFFRALVPLAPARLAYTTSGDLLTRAVADIETLENFYVRVVSPSITALVITLGMGFFTGHYRPVLGWLTAAGLILGCFVVPLIIRLAADPAGKEIIHQRAVYGSEVVEMIQGLGDLIIYDPNGAFWSEICQRGENFGKNQVQISWLTGLGNGLVVFLTGGTAWVLLSVAIPLVGRGTFNGVDLTVLVLSVLASFEISQSMVPAAGMLEASLQAAQRLFDLADTEAEINEPTHPEEMPRAGSLEITGLSFRYSPGGEPVLQDLDLELKPGQRIALIGESGAGKSTLINLLLRFWGGYEGVIRYGGIDLNNLSSMSIRSKLGWVGANGWIFSGSLIENLRIANKSVEEDELRTALEKAGLKEWFATLPDGLSTRISERGLNMSGGERQRLLIARAILQDAPIWLLDEPTYNLDAETERAVLETLLQATEGRQSLWILHHLVGLEKMDEIIVLGGGRVLERGQFTKLTTREGVLTGMLRLQNELFMET